MLKSQAQMPEARRAPGSEWLKNHPKLLEFAYLLAKQLIARIYPLLRRAGPRATERLLLGSEGLIKGYACRR